MTLARHSDPKLTAGVYARAHMEDLGALVERLATGRQGYRTMNR